MTAHLDMDLCGFERSPAPVSKQAASILSMTLNSFAVTAGLAKEGYSVGISRRIGLFGRHPLERGSLGVDMYDVIDVRACFHYPLCVHRPVVAIPSCSNHVAVLWPFSH